MKECELFLGVHLGQSPSLPLDLTLRPLNLSSRGSSVQNLVNTRNLFADFRSASPIPFKTLLVNVTPTSSSSPGAEADLTWTLRPHPLRVLLGSGWSPVFLVVRCFWDSMRSNTPLCNCFVLSCHVLSCPVLRRFVSATGGSRPLSCPVVDHLTSTATDWLILLTVYRCLDLSIYSCFLRK